MKYAICEICEMTFFYSHEVAKPLRYYDCAYYVILSYYRDTLYCTNTIDSIHRWLRLWDVVILEIQILLSNRDIFFCQTGTYYSSKGHTTLQKGHNALEKGHNALQKGHDALEKERNRGGRGGPMDRVLMSATSRWLTDKLFCLLFCVSCFQLYCV